jgi:hypothetical protein
MVTAATSTPILVAVASRSLPHMTPRHAYSEVGFRNVRLDTYGKAGIEGDFRVLRRTHQQILMDRLEAQGRKDVSVIEIAAKRLRHAPQVALVHYVEYRSGRAKDVVKAAWESPRIEVR